MKISLSLINPITFEPFIQQETKKEKVKAMFKLIKKKDKKKAFDKIIINENQVELDYNQLKTEIENYLKVKRNQPTHDFNENVNYKFSNNDIRKYFNLKSKQKKELNENLEYELDSFEKYIHHYNYDVQKSSIVSNEDKFKENTEFEDLKTNCNSNIISITQKNYKNDKKNSLIKYAENDLILEEYYYSK